MDYRIFNAPFVWNNSKVRDLFDSMYRGFPIGYVLLWENENGRRTRPIGIDDKEHSSANRLVIDGQQRLTSLYSVLRARSVRDKNFKERRIEIAFHPRDKKFEVTNPAIRKSPEWVANISDLWMSGKPTHRLVIDYIDRLSKQHKLSESDEDNIARNLDRLTNLLSYPFHALEISANVDEEQVADIFVRINSEGVKLNQSDFVLTLVSVHWPEGQAELEEFCRESRIAPSKGSKPSPFNYIIEPDANFLVQSAIAYGFKRGELKSVYKILRGKDPKTGKINHEQRDNQFNCLKEALADVLNLTNWHQFFNSLIGAGFRRSEMISSRFTLLSSYTFYLLGKLRYSLPEHILQKEIGKWYFGASLTGRYSSSSESVLNSDLARFQHVSSSEKFLETLDEMLVGELTNDFWAITLPEKLKSSASRPAPQLAYLATQNIFGAPVLFSHNTVANLIDPSIQTKKKPLERHHLFPRAWLKRNGVDEPKDINQIANLALVEWPDNINISDKHPSEYVPEIRKRFHECDWQAMHKLHALPIGWETMEYQNFLAERRRLMANTIRCGYNKLRSSD